MTARKSLRDRLAEARERAYLDLIPFAPSLSDLRVRCRALRPDELDRSMRAHADDDTPGVSQALDMIVTTCVGIYEVLDGKGVSLVESLNGTVDLKTGKVSGVLPTFSTPELGEALGVEDGTAAAAVRALLAPHDSDLPLTSYGQEIMRFSTAADAELVAAAPGN